MAFPPLAPSPSALQIDQPRLSFLLFLRRSASPRDVTPAVGSPVYRLAGLHPLHFPHVRLHGSTSRRSRGRWRADALGTCSPAQQRLRWLTALSAQSTIIRRQGFSLQAPAEQEQLVAQSDLPPIHLILTSSATYTIGLLALVNSTLTTASEETLPRLQFHIVSSDDAEAATILELLNDRFGDRVKDKLHPYGLAEFKDDRLEGVVVWAGYRAASLSQVSSSTWRRER